MLGYIPSFLHRLTLIIRPRHRLALLTLLICISTTLLVAKYSPVSGWLRLFSSAAITGSLVIDSFSFHKVHKLQLKGLNGLNQQQCRQIRLAYSRGLLPPATDLHAAARHYASVQQTFFKPYLVVGIWVNVALALLVLGFNCAANLHVSGGRAYWTWNNTANQGIYGLLAFRLAYMTYQKSALRPDPDAARKLAAADKGWFDRHWW